VTSEHLIPLCDGQDHDQPCDEHRRRLCRACIGGMAVLSGGMVAFPVVSFMARPESLELNKPLEVPLDSLMAGQAQYAEYQGQQLIILNDEAGTQVLSASCPHLGCNVIWDAADGVFRCPCHGAIFNTAGDVVRGPVSSPLRKIPFEVKDGKVVVSTEV
jgi:cytochrome b6-f complex iron-sulfur subunit